MIAKNEEDRIARCLCSVPEAAERWVLLDDRTHDATARVAARCGAQVVRAPWAGHVAQKNHALALATQPWVLSLDADEWLTSLARRSLASALAQADDRTQGFAFARASRWLGHDLRHGHWYPDRKVRVCRNGTGRWIGDNPHDHMVVDGPVARLAGDIGHIPYRHIWEHLATIDRYTATAAQSLHRRNVHAAWWSAATHATLHFVDAMTRKTAWRDGWPGVVVAALGAAYSGLKWQRLRRRQRVDDG
ncbi:MAG: glycosyltransferase family 2 protein [Myxococcota bacterium]